MHTPIFLGLIHNAALLIALGLVYDTVALNRRFSGLGFQLLTGLILGSMGIVVMLTPWEFMPGVIFDTRSILLSVSGLFFGAIPTGIAMGITGGLRAYQGGGGGVTGIAVILTSGLIGIIWKHRRRNGLENLSLGELYLFGVVVHVAMLLWMLSLPWPVAWGVLATIGLPVILIYPVGTMLLGKLLVARLVRQQTERTLRESEQKFRASFEQASMGMAQVAADGKFLAVNQRLCEIVGYPKEELLSMTFQDITHPDDLLLDMQHIARVLNGDIDTFTIEKRYLHKTGRIVWIRLYSSVIRDEEGQVKYAIPAIEDITERKQAEEDLKAALREKETLLRELYHRTKNNMQVIRSMLRLQAASLSTPEVDKLVYETENRIQAMSLVHQKLYQSQDLSQIRLDEYLGELMHLLMQSAQVYADRISLIIDVQPVVVLIDTAIPCGLIVNELLSNALKHGFPGERTGEIRLRLRRTPTGPIELSFSDTGVGVPEGFDFRAQETLGLQTIVALAEHQLQGTIAFDTQPEMAMHLTFTDNLYEPRV
ncbi:PAS domain S-box protein [candidate division KSB3 bacterium]|uniref:histidine kinase n=1 Tax=candidate division KSB3 bacterium TaxID=2044937 RepID=A0A9D5Q5D5_9BACT|nr:PAS domain S-box protein [candidate division KSB3 bacterium]MBD3324117.1 PAS domain S-box protein [candidate division KSB3 bacterium]